MLAGDSFINAAHGHEQSVEASPDNVGTEPEDETRGPEQDPHAELRFVVHEQRFWGIGRGAALSKTGTGILIEVIRPFSFMAFIECEFHAPTDLFHDLFGIEPFFFAIVDADGVHLIFVTDRKELLLPDAPQDPHPEEWKKTQDGPPCVTFDGVEKWDAAMV